MIQKSIGLTTKNKNYSPAIGAANKKPARKNSLRSGINRLLNVSENTTMTNNSLAHIKGGNGKNGSK